jgi:hypothetical protein
MNPKRGRRNWGHGEAPCSQQPQGSFHGIGHCLVPEVGREKGQQPSLSTLPRAEPAWQAPSCSSPLLKLLVGGRQGPVAGLELGDEIGGFGLEGPGLLDGVFADPMQPGGLVPRRTLGPARTYGLAGLLSLLCFYLEGWQLPGRHDGPLPRNNRPLGRREPCRHLDSRRPGGDNGRIGTTGVATRWLARRPRGPDSPRARWAGVPDQESEACRTNPRPPGR